MPWVPPYSSTTTAMWALFFCRMRSSSANLDDLYDLFQVKGTCDAATVSGWVMEQVGRVPEEGDHFQAEGLDVIVTRVEHRRVIEIQVRVLPEEEPEAK